jgi:hypothetical protein
MPLYLPLLLPPPIIITITIIIRKKRRPRLPASVPALGGASGLRGCSTI